MFLYCFMILMFVFVLVLLLLVYVVVLILVVKFVVVIVGIVEVCGLIDLKLGEYLWYLEILLIGLIVLVVSFDEQWVYVYCNGIVIGLIMISLGKVGYEILIGVFIILQKDKDYKFNFYNSVLMLYMQCLIWDGIVLYGGSLFGYLVLYGCVCLLQVFVQKLFSEIQCGDIVVVVDVKSLLMILVYLLVLVLVNVCGQVLLEMEGGVLVQVWWNDSVVLVGQVGILVSLYDQCLYVLCDGVMIGELLLKVDVLLVFQGIILFVMGQGFSDMFSLLDVNQCLYWWMVYLLLGQDCVQVMLDLLVMFLLLMVLLVDFVCQLYQVLVLGMILLVILLLVVCLSLVEFGMQLVLEFELLGFIFKGN